MPMPERLDRVEISLSRGIVELPFDGRNELIDVMREVDGAAGAIRAFHAAGASPPVTLRRTDKRLLVEVIDRWTLTVPALKLPAGVWELRNALFDDLVDTPA